jgi:hypothetical protein
MRGEEDICTYKGLGRRLVWSALEALPVQRRGRQGREAGLSHGHLPGARGAEEHALPLLPLPLVRVQVAAGRGALRARGLLVGAHVRRYDCCERGLGGRQRSRQRADGGRHSSRQALGGGAARAAPRRTLCVWV